MAETSTLKRPAEEEHLESQADSKKPKVEAQDEVNEVKTVEANKEQPSAFPTGDAKEEGSSTLLRPNFKDDRVPVSKLGLKPKIPILPSSLELVTGVIADLRARKGLIGEEEVGIIGYAGPSEVKGIQGVIKQRFTDFLVNEVSQSGEVLHLKDISKPLEQEETAAPSAQNGASEGVQKSEDTTESGSKPEDDDAKHADMEVENGQKPENATDTENEQFDGIRTSNVLREEIRNGIHKLWTFPFVHALQQHISDESINKLYDLHTEGRDPPPKQDSGWGGRQTNGEEGSMNAGTSSTSTTNGESSGYGSRGRGQGRDRGRGRGRGGYRGRGGGRGGSDNWWMAEGDSREVVSQPIPEKEKRTAAHKAIRELFDGVFETSSREILGGEGQCLVIKWARGNTRRDRGHQNNERNKRLPQYIHFTLHKSNRETQDALTHLSRTLGCHPKDLTVCGTKDKRAVTVQKVCLKRATRTLNSVWKSANGIKNASRTNEEAMELRGDRGVRIGDLEYSDKFLDLGMLKGNRFLITLRNVQSVSEENTETILSSLRDRGFINFYGMQRFGTSTVPTHVTGLHILRGEWGLALESILSLREGEHPDCVRARLAWLEDGDFEKALEIMPRRCVAERCVWEFYKRGRSTSDKLGALNTIPRNLRTIYVHAYQSYVWNLITSERIKLSATSPIVGDLVYAGKSEETATNSDAAATAGSSKKKNKGDYESSSSREVKVLNEGDLDNYDITDIIMPLPGWNIDYPEGKIGDLYSKIISADGLDINKMWREQREYSLPGGYRNIVVKPSHCSWTSIRYTDPDLPLVQSDEDRILGLNLPIEDDPEGKFTALKLELELPASVYATMALREVTRQETSTWHQMSLTVKSEDQDYKGSGVATS